VPHEDTTASEWPKQAPPSQINWRGTDAHHPAQDNSGRPPTAESGSIRSRARPPAGCGVCPRWAADRAALALAPISLRTRTARAGCSAPRAH
jgi:hypothetical protein